MKFTITKIKRFFWRAIKNILCANAVTKNILYPLSKLSQNFGRGDAPYAWNVFLRHLQILEKNGFPGAQRIFEAGPGRNIGTSLLWWANEMARGSGKKGISIVLWDVYANAKIVEETWRDCANALLNSKPESSLIRNELLTTLLEVAEGRVIPSIEYVVCPCKELPGLFASKPFKLLYSQSALEHSWNMEETWESLFRITDLNGWHSQQIDLADHSHRETNYIEMLEWSSMAYWLMVRFIPGATNRWRACNHLEFIKKLGLTIADTKRAIRPNLPVSKNFLVEPFRSMDERELRTEAIEIIAKLEVIPN